jgi:undecaprenyl diphosphate synthase
MQSHAKRGAWRAAARSTPSAVQRASPVGSYIVPEPGGTVGYGGREEIVDGVKSLIESIEKGHLDKAMINNEVFSKHLYTRYYPDPDLLIRTSGELRLSNFLLWQLSYTEFYITDKLWPDFRKPELEEAIASYSKRQRRFGAV